VEKVVVEIMKVDKATKLFQTMAIVSLNMGNLILEVNTLKNILVTGEKEKEMLHEELNKERNIQQGYKYNVENWKKSRVDVEQKIKVFIEKLQDENEELKGSRT
jgi:bacterioferritin (cytochrome b1)